MIEKRLTALGTAEKDSVEHEIHPSESTQGKEGHLRIDLPRDTASVGSKFLFPYTPDTKYRQARFEMAGLAPFLIKFSDRAPGAS